MPTEDSLESPVCGRLNRIQRLQVLGQTRSIQIRRLLRRLEGVEEEHGVGIERLEVEPTRVTGRVDDGVSWSGQL
jgi:hypothetical protein